MIFGSAPSPVLRIPFSGGDGARDVRTTWEVGRGRGRGRGTVEYSNDEEYPGSSVDPRGRCRVVDGLGVAKGGDVLIGVVGIISGLRISGSGRGLMRGA